MQQKLLFSYTSSSHGSFDRSRAVRLFIPRPPLAALDRDPIFWIVSTRVYFILTCVPLGSRHCCQELVWERDERVIIFVYSLRCSLGSRAVAWYMLLGGSTMSTIRYYDSIYYLTVHFWRTLQMKWHLYTYIIISRRWHVIHSIPLLHAIAPCYRGDLINRVSSPMWTDKFGLSVYPNQTDRLFGCFRSSTI
jgi:hypothetical protein